MFMIDLSIPSHYSVLGVLPDADPSEIRASQSKAYAELDKKLRRTSDPDEQHRLVEQQTRVNAIGDQLCDKERRKAYDKENPHLTFFVIRRAAAPAFCERPLFLLMAHRAARDFLVRKGETVDPITDLERTDFSADFTENALLDTLLRDRPAQRGSNVQA